MKVLKNKERDFTLEEFKVTLTGKEMVIVTRALNYCDDKTVGNDEKIAPSVSVDGDEIWKLWEEFDKELEDIANE